jgi:hypothetical protein
VTSQKWLLSQFPNSEDLAREKYPMVFQSMNGTSFLPGLLNMNHTAPLRKITRSPEKPSAGSSRQQHRPAKNRAEQGVEIFAAGASYHGEVSEECIHLVRSISQTDKFISQIGVFRAGN